MTTALTAYLTGFTANLTAAGVRLGTVRPERRRAHPVEPGARDRGPGHAGAGGDGGTTWAAAPWLRTSPACATKPSTRGCS
ncbi:MAG: hypothetical protein WDN45_15835 [Caulobacteraceae bacterium]